MPELPEVQTVVSDLVDLVKGKKLNFIDILDAKVWFESELGPEQFAGKTILDVTRRGKYIVYHFADGYLLQHLRMTGVMLPGDSDKIPHNLFSEKSPQLRLSLNFDNLKLVFFDVRRFGTFTAILDLDKFFAGKKLAPELYDDFEQAFGWYLDKVAKVNRPIKSVLLDQSIICGPGNIYADESLHAVKIHPLTPAITLESEQNRMLIIEVKQIMDDAIAKRGTSASDYLDVNGNPGVFKQYLKVYKRKGELCLSCELGKIEVIKIGGRTSHFCPHCQILPPN
ncbi:bifunctional DNA-formamidopyrimidine glycosylase/DNA-(apurinic or apyrimidinic site) lyase [Candidatus Gracilibacteria bacterium]|nr:bifunctional DNA-formamidopyrimidine glycosylase/DNA-(apurinic or apyrimidinic site) lyase [Candidatus Gracilibacteria bacterium]